MKKIAMLVLAGWTMAGAARAQVIRFDGEGGGRPNESFSDHWKNQPAPRTPAGREHRDPRRDDGPRGGHDQGRRDRREDRMRGVPDRWNGGGVRRLAGRIDDDAETLYRDYEQNSRTGNFFGKISRAAGLQLLSELSSAARRFRREVDSRWSDPVETRENYRDLIRALDKADDEFFLAYKADTVRGQYRRVSDSIEELHRYYRFHDGGGRGRYPVRCEGVGPWGRWYEGGGCGIHGCWTYGGGCSTWGCWSDGGGCGIHGCWTYGGGCSTWGCWREGGSCGIHGCVGGVGSRPVPSQPCAE